MLSCILLFSLSVIIVPNLTGSTKAQKGPLKTSKLLFFLLLFNVTVNDGQMDCLGLYHDDPGPTVHCYDAKLCDRQCNKNASQSHTANYCSGSADLDMQGRCCFNATAWKKDNVTSVLGIDLQECKLSEQDFSTEIKNMTDLRVISLEGNEFLQNMSRGDFHRNIFIIYLSLPPYLSCPGNPDLWNQINHTEDATICLEELNPCQVFNVTCPSNSHCVHSGVDLTECLCDVGYHGYKCMNQGTFPTLPFLVGIAIPTVILCLILWITQRRYVISQKNK